MREEKRGATKKDLVAKIAARCGTSKKMAELILSEVTRAIQDEVRENGRVQITDFLTIEAKPMVGRMGRNPKTSEDVWVPARVQLFAKFGRGFKEAVNPEE
jgi:DNA-binding protein HU-beta